MVGSDDHRHVVPPAGVERPLHESFTRIARPCRVQQDAGDRLVVHEVGQAVAAQQDAISIVELESVGVHLNIRAGSAEGIRQHVPMGRAGDVVGRKLARVDQQLGKRVVSREAKQATAAEQVGSRVADMAPVIGGEQEKRDGN